MFKYSKKNPLNQIYGKVLAMTLIIIALVIINLLAALTAHQAMRRESDRPIPVKAEMVNLEITAEFEEAINASLRLGDGRIVRWQEVRGA